ncbi:MAG: hypothetical protein WAK40_07595 [Thermoplasmata archaeon]
MAAAPRAVPRARSWERSLPVLIILVALSAMAVAIYASSVFVGVAPALFSAILGAGTLSSLAVPRAVRRAGIRWESALPWLGGGSLALAVVSVVTGIGNGGTDENRTTIAFLGELVRGHDPYTTLLVLHYRVSVLNLWHRSVGSVSYDPYLPLLMFLQVPGTGYLGYDALCLACWGGLLYVVRKDEIAALSLATPMVALVAANGFNDLPVLFLTTLALRGGLGRSGSVLEFVTYGLKQFANVFWIVFYAVQQRWWSVLGVLAGTLVIAAPFLIWHPHGFLCQALTFGAAPGCAAPGGRPVGLYPHWNYYLWILWGVALFEVPLVAWASRQRRRWAGSSGRAPGKN